MQQSGFSDPVFGELRDVYEGAHVPARLWQGSVSVEVFVETLHVQLETTDTLGITQMHYAAFEDFKEHQQNYKQLALAALLDFYQKDILPLWRDNDYFGVPELAPDVHEVSEFETLLSYPRLFIAVHDNSYVLGLEFECTWDVEHGAGVRFRDGKVVAAGLAEVAFRRD
jgi:hypothetical protein